MFYRRLMGALLSLALFSCGSPPVREMPLSVPDARPESSTAIPRPSGGGGVADEIRSLVERGDPASLMRALERIKSLDLGRGDFGRIMNAVAVTLIGKLYPDVQARLPPGTIGPPDPPRTHPYTRILREAAAGIYTTPPKNSQDYLELVLPFLACLDDPQESALPDLKRAAKLNPQGVLAPYFTGLIYERLRQGGAAAESFRLAFSISPEFYPAALGLARYLNFTGEIQEEIDLLSTLVVQYPDIMAIKRQLALAYYNKRDWARAE